MVRYKTKIDVMNNMVIKAEKVFPRYCNDRTYHELVIHCRLGGRLDEKTSRPRCERCAWALVESIPRWVWVGA
jgi:hypothetical protein